MTTPVIRGVNHIGITVPDIEAAKIFLVEAFGGQVIYQSFGPQDPPRQGPEFERAVGASAAPAASAARSRWDMPQREPRW
jgi:catechol 2,3-dioxygenase-like lactoylglutathione lyase family enzyme